MGEIDWASMENAMLTTADRKYLAGEVDPDDRSDFKAWERQRRAQIRDRAQQSLIDFLLISRLDWEDRINIFEVKDSENTTPEGDLRERLIAAGMKDTIRLFYDGLGIDAGHAAVEGATKKALQEQSATDFGKYVEFEVDITVETKHEEPLSNVKQRYDDGEKLSEDELRTLESAGLISTQEYLEGLDRLASAEVA